eukprot:NODE_2429_length_1180_cov_17.984805_g2314_i0.p1 GENE.NODE_2429_length_1180_cov_17.984805_g2314_i0~~NODE_2429_length_1180_cov_17.984805_g2314_i0.p1  ORF type:complete len:383 (-),score=66.60 NODE_2429_length_1180_cov_17.984805_g2314_i0:30-1076(-)
MESIEALARLGAGQFGEVFKVRRHSQVLAMKKILCGNVQEANDAIREAFLLKGHTHPHIIAYHDVFLHRQGERCYICLLMDYVDGGDLEQYIRCTPRIALQWVLEISAQIADALSFLHSSRLMHRDLKPLNILLSSNHHHAILTDFGLVRPLDETLHTITGTPAYMSPEQRRCAAVRSTGQLCARPSLSVYCDIHTCVCGALKSASTIACRNCLQNPHLQPMPSSPNPPSSPNMAATTPFHDWSARPQQMSSPEQPPHHQSPPHHLYQPPCSLPSGASHAPQDTPRPSLLLTPPADAPFSLPAPIARLTTQMQRMAANSPLVDQAGDVLEDLRDKAWNVSRRFLKRQS